MTRKYILGDLVGTGGMGVVHRAVVEGQAAPVAVKQLRPEISDEPVMIQRFETELRVGRVLNHPNIARMIDFGDTPAGLPFLVMAWAEGEPLGTRLARTGALPERDAVAIATRLLDALTYAHDRGIAHGDVKSDNLLVAGGGDAPTVTLIDWGLARFLAEPAGRATEYVSGTPGYMAPEVLVGDPPTTSSDLYAAGVILFELLTGTPPFGTGSGTEIAERQLAGVLEPPSVRAPERRISPSLDRAVIRSLALAPTDRYATARELAAAITLPTPRAETVAAVAPSVASEILANRRTLDWTPHTETRRRLALGRRQPAPNESAIATACLSRVSGLLEAHRLRDAARELERAIAQTTTPHMRWPLILSLAAVHSGLGHREDAIRLAGEAWEHSRRAHAPVGEIRAEALLRKVTG